MGIFDSIVNYLSGNGQSQSPAPAGNPSLLGDAPADFGQLRPQMPSYQQYSQDSGGAGAFFRNLAGGHGGVGMALAGLLGDPNALRAQYNNQLGSAQGEETNRLNLVPWENPMQGGVGPAQMKSPLGAPSPLQQSQDLTAQTGFSPGGSVAQQPGDFGAMPGAQLAASQGQPAPQSAPNILDPKVLAQQIAFLRQSPAGMAQIPKYMEVLDSMNQRGTGFDANGNQYRLGGANSADYQKNLYESLGKNLQTRNPDGSIQSIPGVITDAAQKAGAVKRAEANAQNASDYFYKPQIADATKAAEFPYTITELRPDQKAGTTGQLGIQPVFPRSSPLGNLGTVNLGGKGAAPTGPVAGGPVMGRTSEEVERGKTLGEEYDTVGKAASAAEDLQSRIQFIQREMPKAMKGTFADQKAEVGRMLIGLGVPEATVNDKLGNVASADILQKEFYRLSTDQVKGLGREPGYILDKITSANPNLATQPEAMLLMSHAVDQGAQRMLDKRAGRDAWLADPKHMGSLAGFADSFNQTNPQEMYVNRAYQRTDGVPEGSKLVASKNNNRVWQLPNGEKFMARH